MLASVYQDIPFDIHWLTYYNLPNQDLTQPVTFFTTALTNVGCVVFQPTKTPTTTDTITQTIFYLQFNRKKEICQATLFKNL